jgi:hypothetical protein
MTCPAGGNDFFRRGNALTLINNVASIIESQRRLRESISSELPITVDAHLFFLERRP